MVDILLILIDDVGAIAPNIILS